MKKTPVITHPSWLKILGIALVLFSLVSCPGETVTTTEPTLEPATPTATLPPTTTPSQTLSPTPPPTWTETATLPPSATTTPTRVPFYTRTPTPLPEGVEMVELKTADGIELVGFFHTPESPASDSVAVVLGHELGANHGNWGPFAARLVELGYTTLTFDFRGHGASPGTRDFATIGIDAAAAIQYLNLKGFDRVICIGASMGGTACLTAAATGTEIAGLGMLSSPRNIPGGPNLVSKADIGGMTFPKVFMIAEEDYASPTFVDDFIEMVELAGEPKQFYLYPGMAHGTGLLYGDRGDEAQENLLRLVDAIKAR